MVDVLSVTSCSAATDAVLLLYLLPVVSVFFIVLGLGFRIGFLGVFGSILLLVFSWFFASCSGVVSLLVASLGLVLLVWFAVGTFRESSDSLM